MKESNELSNCQDKSHFQRFFFFFQENNNSVCAQINVYTFIFKYNDNIMDSFYTGLKQVSFFLFPPFHSHFHRARLLKAVFLKTVADIMHFSYT